MKFTAEVKLSLTQGAIFSRQDNEKMVKFFSKALGKRVFATLETETKNRSLSQNAYYWGVIIDLLSEHCGFTTDEMHEILKHKFLRRSVWIVKKHGIEEQSIITKSTQELTTKEFEDYLSKVREWSSLELGVYIPLPNEAIYANAN
jgi:hypothetical protein